MKHKIKNIHFVGIGGSGMNGIAEVLLNLGFQISGSDILDTPTTKKLKELGVQIHIGHRAENVCFADVIVVSSAISQNNPEVLIAKEKHIPIVPRALMLAELMRFRQGIAIAGTHGKTSTTSMVASILAEAGLDPTYVIGGRLNATNTNAKLGEGEFIVVEADESDLSFLHLSPVISVVTNIDNDHMETYQYDLNLLKNAFIQFIERLPFWGRAILCIDDDNIREISEQITKPITSYGLNDNADIYAVDIKAIGSRMHFTVKKKNDHSYPVILNLPGIHYVQNALAAIAIAEELNIEASVIQKALSEFKGVGRRFEQYGEIFLSNHISFSLIDDYGHHPTEISAVIQATRQAFPERRLVLAFQPHRYTRTKNCFADFVRILSRVDFLALTEIYSAGEEPISEISGQALITALKPHLQDNLRFLSSAEELPEALLNIVQHNDVVLIMGAGSIGHIAPKLKQKADECARLKIIV